VGFRRGGVDERAYEVEDLEGGGMRWVRAVPFYFERGNGDGEGVDGRVLGW